MNWPTEWNGSLEVTARTGIGVAVVVILTVALTRLTKSPLWRRVLWQAAFVGILSLLLVELADVPAIIRTLRSERKSSRLEATADQTTASPSRNLPGLRTEFRTEVLRRLQENRLASLKAQATSDAVPYLGERVLPWPSLIWFFGTLATLGVMLAARLFFIGLSYRWRELDSEELRTRSAVLARQLGLRRRVKLLEAPPLKAPAALGFLRAVIAVPADFASKYTHAQQEAMLAHELAHISAADPLWQAVSDLAAALFWWHPLIWWARRRFRASCEAAADEGSLVLADGPNELAQCLLVLASQSSHEPSRAGLSVTGFRSGLGQRIERLLDLKGRWSPPRGWRVLVLKTLFPISLLAVVTVCSAWVGPQTKGASMHSIVSTWRRSVATLALLGAVGAEHGHLQVANAAGQTDQPTPAAEPATATDNATASATDSDRTKLLEDARLLLEVGKLDEAEAKLQLVLKQHPENKRALRLMDQIRTLRAANQPQPATAPGGAAPPFRMDPRLAARYGLRADTGVAPVADPNYADNTSNSVVDRYHMDPRLAARYGLLRKPTDASASAPAPNGTPGHAKADVEAKLNQIVLSDVLYDGLPLGDVVRDLNDQARRRDPEKKGINFLISNVPSEPILTGIDPTTGQPIASPTFDLAPVLVRLHLRDVRLKDVLDAMTKVSDRPLRYAVEDYGVIFSPGLGPNMPAPSGVLGESTRLQVRTFYVDKQTFLPGLESAFGVSVHQDKAAIDSRTEEKLAQIDLQNAKEKYQRLKQLDQQHLVANSVVDDAETELKRAEVRVQGAHEKAEGQSTGTNAREIQQALRDLLRQLGINMDVSNKAVFYNDLTGIVMVRATADDLELVQAAIETLGGKMLKPATAVLGDIPNTRAAAATPNTEK